MKSIIYAFIAMLGYSLANVLLEQKLSKVNNFTLMICYSGVFFVFAILARQITKTDDPSYNFPTGSLLMLALSIGIIFTIADGLFITSYTSGGSLITITSIIALFPVFASLFKFLLTKETPNMWQISGYTLAFFSLLLIAKGGMK